MKTTKEQLAALFDMKSKTEIAAAIDVILDDFVSSIGVRLEREYTFIDKDEKFIASDCFITPPAKGEFYDVSGVVYEVISVTHVFRSSVSPGTIIVKK